MVFGNGLGGVLRGRERVVHLCVEMEMEGVGLGLGMGLRRVETKESCGSVQLHL